MHALETLFFLRTFGTSTARSSIFRNFSTQAATFAGYGAEEQFSQDELVRRLEAMRENVRHRYNVGPTLEEQLAAAVLAENYELAAELRRLVPLSLTKV